MIEQEYVGNISQEDLDEKGKRKRHHYVPRWLQKGFTDDDGLLWTADKKQGEPKRISPKNLFTENRLNQVQDPNTSDGQLRMMLDGEDAFSERETMWKRYTPRPASEHGGLDQWPVAGRTSAQESQWQ